MNKIKLIPPLVMLAATSTVAVITYLRDFPFGTWLVVVIAVMVLFLFIGEFLRQMIEYFMRINEEKQKAEEEALLLQQQQEEENEGLQTEDL